MATVTQPPVEPLDATISSETSTPSTPSQQGPKRPKRTHTLPPTTALSSQVGGHSGVQTTEDGSLLLKPALPNEVAFYQLVRDSDTAAIDAATVIKLKALKEWIPKFYGVLNLEGRIADPEADLDAGVVPTMIVPATEHSHSASYAPSQTLVLENVTYGFIKPCILDVKLGKVLYDEDASPEKRQHMIEVASETTSFTTGVRLTGFQVYANDSPDPIVTPKSYGKSIKPDQLPEGIAKFFPVCLPLPQSASTTVPSSPDSSLGLPPSILLPLLKALHTSLRSLREALQQIELRMVGGSVLVIYEADWERASAGLKQLDRAQPAEESKGDDVDEEIEVEIDENGQIVMDSLLGSNADSESLSSPSSSSTATASLDPPRLFSLYLIDFAHTRLASGQGSDIAVSGVLDGLQTAMDLVQGRVAEVEALVGEGMAN
ncbi:inositol polyphosphate multikinase [Phlebopus sp. FC_14]|nr:inositol polyphosphate multikinase [Phlebopus sp. FC_14]